MTIQSVLAQSSVTDLSVAERWYSAAFGRGPDTRPMDGLIEWHLTEMSGVQVWVDAERAGHSTIVVGESSLDGLVARLSGAGIDHPDPQQATTSRILPLVDPDGNRVVFTESPMASSADEIRGIGRLVIREGKRNEFEHLVARAMEVVRKKDPGTIEYSVYLDADGTEAIVHERYRDSAAGLAHSENLAVLMPAFLDAATISGEVCGSPSPELREALEAAGVKIYTPLRSM